MRRDRPSSVFCFSVRVATNEECRFGGRTGRTVHYSARRWRAVFIYAAMNGAPLVPLATLLFGCCSNVVSLEYILRYSEHVSFADVAQSSDRLLPRCNARVCRGTTAAGTLVTFCQFLFVALTALPNVLQRLPGTTPSR